MLSMLRGCIRGYKCCKRFGTFGLECCSMWVFVFGDLMFGHL